MTAEYAQAVDRWVEEIRAACGIPPALIGAAPQTEAEVRRNMGLPPAQVPERSPEETLASVDAAVEGRCPCGADPRPGSAYCSPDCEPTHRGPDTDAPWSGPRTAARWRPDLVTAFDDSGLELVEEITDRHLTRRWYHHRERGRFLRLDDGNRFVGTWAPEDGPADELWRRLERELGDRRRLDPEPGTSDMGVPGAGFPGPPGLSAEQVRATICEWLRANGIDPDLVPENGSIEVRDGMIHCEVVHQQPGGELGRRRIVVRHRCRPPWPGTGPCPNCVGRCEVDLTPYLAPAGTASTATSVDETHVDPAPPHRWRERVDLVVLGDGGSPELVNGQPGRGRPQVPTERTVLAEMVLPPAWRLLAARSRLRAWLGVQWDLLRGLPGRVERWLFPLTYCPIHGRAQCGWPDWRAVAAVHRGGPVRRRLRINLHVDASGYDAGMARATEAFRRAGEAVAEIGAGMTAAFQSMPLVTQQAIQDLVAEAESDRTALRAVCADEAMYERALAAARERGWSARRMMAAVAAGEYTEQGWTEADSPAGALDADLAGIVTAAPDPAVVDWSAVEAAALTLEGRNPPPVRFDAGAAVVETLRSQAPRNRAPGLPADGLLGIPIVSDESLAPDSWRLEYADGQRYESHVCRWEVSFESGYHRCGLHWSDGHRCESRTVDPSVQTRTERLVGPRATGDAS